MRNKFQRGSGCFSCHNCSRLTRQTNSDNAAVRLCPQCYEIAGWENTCSDNPEGSDEYKIAEREIARLTKIVIAKGGKLTQAAPVAEELPEIAGAANAKEMLAQLEAQERVNPISIDAKDIDIAVSVARYLLKRYSVEDAAGILDYYTHFVDSHRDLFD